MRCSRAISCLLILAMLLCVCSGCNNHDQTGTAVVTPAVFVDPYEEEKDLKPYYEYADTVYDRSVVDGKLAVYYIRGDADMDTYESNTVSGDATLIIAPNGETMLIDCNMTSCASFIVAMLQRLGIEKLDYFMVSHPHGDHIGGWDTLLRYIDIGKVYHTGSKLFAATDNRYVTGFIDAIEAKNIPHEVLATGNIFNMGDVKIDVLWPDADTDWETCEPTDADQNNYSLAVKITYGKSSFLTCGDIESTTENLLVKKYGEALQADVAKMNHHGHDSSETIGWIQCVSPLVSVAERYAAHDEGKVFGNYISNNVLALYTALDKTVCVSTTGDGSYTVQVEHDREFLQDWLPASMQNGTFEISQPIVMEDLRISATEE